MKVYIQLRKPSHYHDLCYTKGGVFIAENGNTRLFEEKEAEEFVVKNNIEEFKIIPWAPMKISMDMSGTADRFTLANELRHIATMLEEVPLSGKDHIKISLPNSLIIIKNE